MKKYKPKLNIIDTQRAIKLVKDSFENKLADVLNLVRVSAPLFVTQGSGLNDDLNGHEKPVSFTVNGINDTITIVQSLAKWKRYALKKYGFPTHSGLYADMNAIRRDEVVDNIHSIYVDQWDWEAIINKEDRNLAFLERVVRKIYRCIKEVQKLTIQAYPCLTDFLSEDIYFITSEELLQMYPSLTPKVREYEITKKYGSVFIEQIGCELSDGNKHDGRAPDYDDWELNGDILVYYPPLDQAIELSSMGIRVSPESLAKQLEISNKTERKSLPFHKELLSGNLPYTIGGGIGQSRLCLIMLNKIHIGEVQSSLWNGSIDDEISPYIL